MFKRKTNVTGKHAAIPDEMAKTEMAGEPNTASQKNAGESKEAGVSFADKPGTSGKHAAVPDKTAKAKAPTIDSGSQPADVPVQPAAKPASPASADAANPEATPAAQPAPSAKSASGPQRASAAQTRRARRAAAATTAVVAVFAAVFIALVMWLDVLASTSANSNSVDATIYRASDPFYVTLIGSDSRKGTAFYTGRKNELSQVEEFADVVTLVRVDPQTYTVTLVSVPRDTRVPDTDQKLSATLRRGDPLEVNSAVARITGIQPDYYMMVTFTDFEAIVDELGGITVDVPYAATVGDPVTGGNVKLKEGAGQLLDGSHSLALARALKDSGANRDAYRQQNVRAIEKAIVERALAPGEEADTVSLMSIVGNRVETDVDVLWLGQVVHDFAKHAEDVEVYACTGPFEGEERGSTWTVFSRPITWKMLMLAVDAGEDPTGIVPQP